MIVKVLGIGHPNKGAELMLAAIENKITELWPDATVVDKTSSDLFTKGMFFLNRKFSIPLLPHSICDMPSIVPKSIRKLFGITADADVSVFLDASGFAYGDQWGVQKLYQRITYTLPAIKRTERVFIVMPQALGPFLDSDFKDQLQTLSALADFVYVRDRTSLRHLTKIIGTRDNVALSPDFTNLISGSETKASAPGDFAIIPNSKMMEMNVVKDEKSYSSALAAAARYAQSLGYQPFLLNHAGQKDLAFIEQINGKLNNSLPIVNDPDPLRIKLVLGDCKLVLSSRFHGLVSALSQSVPVVAIGWSHKYQELLSDYGCEKYVVSAEESVILNALGDIDAHYQEVKDEIFVRSQDQKFLVKKMWDDIDAIVSRMSRT